MLTGMRPAAAIKTNYLTFPPFAHRGVTAGPA
jgi:hypothetical protein